MGEHMKEFYQVEEILPKVYRIGSGENVFEFLFVGEQRALLFDTGYGFGDLAGRVRGITDLPLYIVNSHGHLDHVCGNFHFQEQIYINVKDMELCREHNSKEMRRGAIEGAKNTLDYQTKLISNILPEDFDEESYVNQGYGNLIPMEEGHIFELGNMSLVSYEFPGHTQGSMGLYYQQEKVLFTGDAMNPFLWLFAPEATDLATYKKSLVKAKNLELEKVGFSHNPFLAPASILDDFIDCAEQVDYEKGFPFEAPYHNELEPRICPRVGYGPMDMMKPGFASIVISKSHL
jgi:glyoxylase-like metal-dependent hydrolase (beta-lactamase superfamily II)